ncbi:hypothetical protein VHUM_01775 [Vanrija humicola]|uniref:G-patch domain-containing protein n=1 Tax=Vanrija humicola TaxID=5417 RepID=A0A7D8ZRM1_VANHU|nr:hypothetical protein VHUM_01775 [Vanrija humicola]
MHRARSRSPDYRPQQRGYSPSRAVGGHSPPPPPRRYDAGRRFDDDGGGDRRPPPRRYDDERRYDRDRPLPYAEERRYGGGGGGYGGRDYYDDEDRRRDDRRERRPQRDDHWDRERRMDVDDHAPARRRAAEPSPPSRDVILLGLDPELTETELASFLRTEHGAAVDSTKIVRDRSTGQSKLFGFAQFSTVEDAERFVSANMPALYSHSDPKTVKIDFAGARADSNRGAPGGAAPAFAATPRGHDGMRDIGSPGEGQRVLLLRHLDQGTYAGEVTRRLAEEISRMIGKGSERDAEAAISRVVMITDRGTSEPWGFAFVEVVTPELATALLSYLLSPQHQPNGFLISQVPIAVSFANSSAFIPSPAGPLGGQYLLKAAPNGGIGATNIASPDGEYCAYWHQQAGAVETIPRGAPPVPARGSPLDIPAGTKTFLGNLAGAVAVKPKAAGSAAAPAAANSEPAEAGPSTQATDATPAPLTGSMGPIKIGGFGSFGKKAKKTEEVGLIHISGRNAFGDEEDVDLVGKDTVLLSRTKGAKIIPPTSTSRKVATNISKWNTKQSELSAPKAPAPPKGVSGANAVVSIRPPGAAAAAAAASSSNPDAASADEAEFDYTDTSSFATSGKVACLLCQRQFKIEDTLRKHVALSDLHKARTPFTPEPQAGRRRKLGLGGVDADGAGAYRDRAAERRVVHHQPDKPSLPSLLHGRKPLPEPKPKAPSPPPAAPAPAADESNVGNKLLSKMGWASGTGLGKEGEGRVDPIHVKQFEERSGLGASKGREAGAWSGPGGWQQRKKDMVGT